MRETPLLIFALLYPLAMSWLYFIYLAAPEAEQNPTMQTAAAFGKAFQLALPMAAMFFLDRQRLHFTLPTRQGLGLGLLFGAVVAAGIFALYFFWLRDSSLLGDTPQRIYHKVQELGAGSLLGFLLLASFVALAHSLLEEYYWRWFVFDRLQQRLPLWPAILISSLGFMSYHVVVLWVYFRGQFWTLGLLFSLAVGIGGIFWAYLYHQTRSLWAVWLSHIVVDVALMAVGYDMLRDHWH